MSVTVDLKHKIANAELILSWHKASCIIRDTGYVPRTVYGIVWKLIQMIAHYHRSNRITKESLPKTRVFHTRTCLRSKWYCIKTFFKVIYGNII